MTVYSKINGMAISPLASFSEFYLDTSTALSTTAATLGTWSTVDDTLNGGDLRDNPLPAAWTESSDVFTPQHDGIFHVFASFGNSTSGAGEAATIQVQLQTDEGGGYTDTTIQAVWGLDQKSTGVADNASGVCCGYIEVDDYLNTTFRWQDSAGYETGTIVMSGNTSYPISKFVVKGYLKG